MAEQPRKSKSAIEEALIRRFSDRGTAVDADTDLIERELIDSLDVVELVSDMETEFGVEIPDEKLVLESFRTVSQIASLVDDLTAA